ncbi:TPA: LacI family DNA-binding transcriptional regulator, partial [Escherichia coli]|nr:LacI family DNA-binding transcriptional regulator [Escherichia coli]
TKGCLIANFATVPLIRTLRLVNGKSLRETARLAGVSKMTVIRVCSSADK